MTSLEIGQKSAEIARGELLKHCRSVSLSPRKVCKRIAESLDATEVKTHYDKDRGKWVYSTLMIDWAARAKAIDQAICILDLKPVERKSLEIDMAESVPERIAKVLKEVVAYAHPE